LLEPSRGDISPVEYLVLHLKGYALQNALILFHMSFEYIVILRILCEFELKKLN